MPPLDTNQSGINTSVQTPVEVSSIQPLTPVSLSAVNSVKNKSNFLILYWKPIILSVLILIIAIGITLYFLSLKTPAGTLITFDDLKPSSTDNLKLGTFEDLENNYQHLTWNNFRVQNNDSTSSSGYVSGTVSAPNSIYNVGAKEADIEAADKGETFDLLSAYLTAAWNDGLKVQVIGYYADKVLYDNTYTLNATAPKLINFDYKGVDKMSFVTSGGALHPGYSDIGQSFGNFIMDNVRVNIYNDQPIKKVEDQTQNAQHCSRYFDVCLNDPTNGWKVTVDGQHDYDLINKDTGISLSFISSSGISFKSTDAGFTQVNLLGQNTQAYKDTKNGLTRIITGINNASSTLIVLLASGNDIGAKQVTDIVASITSGATPHK